MFDLSIARLPHGAAFQHKARLSLAVFAACSLLAQSALAADSNIEEITIVGQGVGSLRLQANNGAGSRLGLTALQTPASVDLVTRAEIVAKGDYNSIDSITRTAGISTSSNNGNGGMQISTRGFNGHGTTVNMYDGTRLYITAGTVTFPADTWTLDRVEVLRGAGSVLNGAGALATTINYIPRSPSFEGESAEAQISGGSFGLKRIALDANLPMTDSVALRGDIAITDKDGYVDRGDSQRKVAAVSALFRPSADLSMKLSVDYADIDEPRYFGTPLVNGDASDALRDNNYNYNDSTVHYRDVWTRLHTEWNIADNITFRNDTFLINADREWQNLEEYYYNSKTKLIDRMSYLGIRHDQTQAGTRGDVLFTSAINGMDNRFNIGADLNNVDLDYSNNFNTGGFDVADSVPVFDFPATARPKSAFTQLDYTTETTQYGIFFDDNLQLNDKLSLAFGGRYDNFDYNRVNVAQVTGRGRREFDAGFSKFTWRAGVVYQISDNFSAYAQTSTAADPVTSPISINLANADFKLSEGRQYEVGLKQQFSGGEYTLAYFDIKKENMVTRLPGATVSTQIGEQSSDGLEATLRLNPLENVSIDLNAAFIDSQYDKFYVGTTSLAGNTPNGIPETTFNGWVNWTPMAKLQLGGGFRYVDERYTDDMNTATLPAYTVFDASASWIFDEKTTLTLRARNLTDEEDYVLSEYVPDQWVFGEPRAYELSVQHKF